MGLEGVNLQSCSTFCVESTYLVYWDNGNHYRTMGYININICVYIYIYELGLY